MFQQDQQLPETKLVPSQRTPEAPLGEHIHVDLSHSPKGRFRTPLCQRWAQLLPEPGCRSTRCHGGWAIPTQQHQVCLLVFLRAVSEKAVLSVLKWGLCWTECNTGLLQLSTLLQVLPWSSVTLSPLSHCRGSGGRGQYTALPL